MVSLEFVGRDRLLLHGSNKLQLSHFRLNAEDTDDWDPWVDNNHKLVRILIPSSKTEVLRDANPNRQTPRRRAGEASAVGALS